jgi:hypothetical protein
VNQTPVDTGVDDNANENLPNVDRLRGHLRPDGLAASLLDAWNAGGYSGASDRLLTAFRDFHLPKVDDDGSPSKD